MLPAQPHSVVLVAAVPGQEKALRTLPIPPQFDHVVSAIVDDRLALVVARRRRHRAGRRDRQLPPGRRASPPGSGFGGGYTQANGLRWSFFEAVEALRHGERINTPSKLSLTSLLLAARDVPLQALAQEALEPLQAFDKKTFGRVAGHIAQLPGTRRKRRGRGRSPGIAPQYRALPAAANQRALRLRPHDHRGPGAIVAGADRHGH